MSEAKIEPALTAEEWSDIAGVPGEYPNIQTVNTRGIVIRAVSVGAPEIAIAVLNNLLPDPDPRKITHDGVAALRAIVERAPESWADRDADARAKTLLDALASYLPPGGR